MRVVNIYATRWRYRGTDAVELRGRLDIDQLEDYYDMYRDQLPKVLPEFEKYADDIRLQALLDDVWMDEANMHMFTLPSNQVVVAVTFELRVGALLRGQDARPVVALIEQCMEDRLLVAGVRIGEFLKTLGTEAPTLEFAGGRADLPALRPERHHLVFIARGMAEEPVPSHEIVGEIVFREKPPYREEFAEMMTPEQLNLRIPADSTGNLVTLGVVTPTVSLIYGHERFVEDSIFISTVQAVGTAARFHEIWLEAYVQVRTFRDEKQRQSSGLQVRADLEELADNLGNLEFDLTFSVRFPLMPPRIESFHSALYEALDLSSQAQLLSQMFTQLAGSLRSEITAIDIRERRKDDGRQKWNSFAAAILSLVGVSVGFVVTFLGINAAEVGDDLSMWDGRYSNMYFVASLFALTPVLLIVFPYVRDWSRRRDDLVVVWLGLAVAAIGGLLELYYGPPRTVVAAVFMAMADFFIVLGAGIGVEWLIRKIRSQ